jgi:hypothetical protein
MFESGLVDDVLTEQGRMHPNLSEIHQRCRLCPAITSSEHTRIFEMPGGMDARYCWVDHRYPECVVGAAEFGGSSHVN